MKHFTLSYSLTSLAVALLLLYGNGEAQTAEVLPAATVHLAADSTLQELEGEALANLPELARARALVSAEELRAKQAGALPDPVLSLGIQNDGFERIEIGHMENSYWSTMASQTFPWFGKRGLRANSAAAQAKAAQASLERLRLSTAAAVDRAYLDLLLVRARLELQVKVEALATQAEEYARIRYETGSGTQADFLRAQLQRNRLNQRRWALAAEEQTALAALNRMRGHAPDDSVTTHLDLITLADPALPDLKAAITDAEQRSPDLAAADALSSGAARELGLARKNYFSDVTLSAGVMPRGRDFPLMWTAGVSFSLPLWSGRKQRPAIAEARARLVASTSSTEAIRQTLRQRVSERLTLAQSLTQSNRLYRSGLIVQSEATVNSTLAQFRVGNAAFVSVLEAISGYLSDYEGLLQSVVDIQRVAIAQQEVSLNPTAVGSGSGFPGIEAPAGQAGSGAMSGSGSSAPSSAPKSGMSGGTSGM